MKTQSKDLPKGFWEFLWHFAQKQWKSFLLAQVLWLSWSLGRSVLPLLFGNVVDGIVSYNGHRHEAWSALQQPIFTMLVFWTGIEIAFRLSGTVLAKTFPKFEGNIRLSIFNYILDHSYHYFSNQHTGSLATKIIAIPESLKRIVSHIISIFIPSFVAILIAVCIFFKINPLFAALLGGWALLHICLYACFSRKCSTLSQSHAEARSLLYGSIIDSIVNHFSVRIFNRKSSELEEAAKLQREEQAKDVGQNLYIEKLKLGLAFLALLFACFGINGYAFFYWTEGLISAGEVVTIFTVSWNLVIVVWLFGSALPDVFKEIGTCKQALSLSQTPIEIRDVPHAQPLCIEHGSIEFRKVHFTYPGAEPLFSEKSIKIQPGKKVGLVGYSGSGKTTFVNLILRLFDIQSGQILIDGQNIAHVTQKSLRQAISMVPQDPMLFHRSLLDNIRYACPEASQDQVIEAAKKAHAHDFIINLPQGYDSLVGERGIKLSAGQRQRIAIARAFLKDASLILLDEATSALDSLTETLLQESLAELMKNKTAIIIAHRLSTLLSVDRLLVFDQGQIIEEGSHAELLNRGGFYKKLWEAQVENFIDNQPIQIRA